MEKRRCGYVLPSRSDFYFFSPSFFSFLFFFHITYFFGELCLDRRLELVKGIIESRHI